MFVTKYRRGVFNTEMLNLCEQLMAQVCTDFGATLAEFNGAQDHVHLLAAYPPKVALSHLVNNLKGVSPAGPTGLRSAVHSQGLHHQPETTRLGKVSSLP